MLSCKLHVHEGGMFESLEQALPEKRVIKTLNHVENRELLFLRKEFNDILEYVYILLRAYFI